MRRQFFGGVLGQGAGLASTLIIQLAQVPILLSVLGAVGYGQYLITISVPSLLVLTDFGLLAAFSTAMLQAVAAGDPSRARELSRLAAAILFCIAAIALVGLGLGSVIVVMSGAFPVWAPAVFVLYGLYALVGIQTNALEGILRADGRQAKTWTFVAGLRVCEFLAAAASLLASQSIVAFAATLLIARCLGTALLWVHSARVVGWASRRPSFVGWRSHLGLLRPMIGSLTQPATNYLYLQGTVIVVGATLGPIAVAQLGVLRTFSGLLKQGAQVFTLASIPLLTRASATGDHMTARSRTRATGLLVGAALVPAAAILILLGPSFIGWWTHEEVAVSTLQVSIFTVEAVCEVALVLCTMGLIARNRHFAIGVSGLIAAASYIVVASTFAASSLESVIVTQIAFVLATVCVALVLNRRDRNGEFSKK